MNKKTIAKKAAAKAEPVKVEEKKLETPVVEAPKTETVKVETPKTEAVKAEPEKKPAVKKAPAKKPAAKKAPAAKVAMTVEYQGKQVSTDAILAAVKDAVKDISVKTMELYVKPEDDAVYYVVNGDVTGKVAF